MFQATDNPSAVKANTDPTTATCDVHSVQDLRCSDCVAARTEAISAHLRARIALRRSRRVRSW